MSASSTLNLANYTTVWDHNFATEPNLDGFTVWGDVTVQNGAAVVTSGAAEGWPQAGFMVPATGPAAGTGYGLYSVTLALSANGAVEGPGGYACLWPASNVWPGPELDLVEKGDASSGSNAYSTIHWAGADGSNQYSTTMLGPIDVTQPHTYAMDWEPGRITLYVDGQEIYTTTQNVPKDYADGGQNEAFGVGEEPAWAASEQGTNSENQVYVYDISYAAYTPTNPTSTPASPTTTSNNPAAAQTGTGAETGGGVTPNGWITLSAPGTVQAASSGQGVDVPETVSAPGLSVIYEAVFTSDNVAEENWQPVTLDADGKGTFTAHFEHSGDYVVAVNDPNTQTAKGWSTPITITDAASGGSVGGSVPVGGTTTAGSDPSAGKADGGPASDGPTDITLSGNHSLAADSPAWTVVGTLSAIDANPITFVLGQNPNGIFSIDGDKLLINRELPADSARSYQVGIIAVDSAGAVASQTVTLDVSGATDPSGGGVSPSAVGTGGVGGGVKVTATDGSGHSATIPLGAVTTTELPGTSGLTGAVTVTPIGGVQDISTPLKSGVDSLSILDAAGGSYQSDGFARVDASLSGATAGSLTINDAKNATVVLGDGNYTVRVFSPVNTAAVQMTAGSGTDQLTFIGTAQAHFTAGSGKTVIVGGAGGNDVTFGTGSATVWGGAGADSYTFHAGDGLQTIATFDTAKGDVLNIDSSLRSSLQESTTAGGTLLSFGDTAHGILLQGVSTFDTALIHWI